MIYWHVNKTENERNDLLNDVNKTENEMTYLMM